MLIKRLSCDRLRNLPSIALDFKPGLNVITGPNASGKTNLLEAIYIALTGSSYRVSALSEVIQFGCERAQIGLLLESSGMWQEKVVVEISEKSKKILLNSKNVQSIAGHFPLVTWMPEDLEIIRSGPKYRRSYLDQILFIKDPLYLYHSRRLNRALKLKNSALKLGQASSIDAINPEIASASVYITQARFKVLMELEPLFCSAMQELNFAGQGPGHALKLRSHCLLSLDEMKSVLKQVKAQEMASRSCLKGAHLDEVEILLNGSSARRFASLGQARCLVASLKIAQVKLLGDLEPWLLIDEVGMGLDQKRMQAVWKMMGRWKQAFVTTPDLQLFEEVSSDLGDLEKVHTIELPLSQRLTGGSLR